MAHFATQATHHDTKRYVRKVKFQLPTRPGKE